MNRNISRRISKDARNRRRKGATTKDNIDWLIKKILHLPQYWIVLGIFFIVVSLFEISWIPGDNISFSLKISNSSIILFALMWFPSVIKVFALVGAAFETPLGEVGTDGLGPLLGILESDTLGILIEQTNIAEAKALSSEEKQDRNQLAEVIKQEYAARIPYKEVHEEMNALAFEYGQLRQDMPKGSERTLRMESLAGRILALAPRSEISREQMTKFLQSEDEGKRLLGLTIIQWSGDSYHFDDVVATIAYSKSGFEQRNALQAVATMLAKLTQGQINKLLRVIDTQCDYDPERRQWIKENSNRGILCARIRSTLEKSKKMQ